MTATRTPAAIVLLAAIFACTAAIADPPKPLTAAETAAGWKYAFDGSSSTGWKGYKGDSFPAKGWVVEDGTLHNTKGGGGGDIVTTDQYGDFELSLDFKCSPGANSGIMYRVADGKSATYSTGPEYQVLD